ncbi:MAG: glycosyltransferase [Calditrichaeota bacterium]|nr:glycosyltransferase [Calditrichota bacterium]
MKKVSVIMQYREGLSYSDAELNESIKTLVNQNYPHWELILVDYRGKKAARPPLLEDERIIHLPGTFKNRAQGLNAALARATGDAVLLVDNIRAHVSFRTSTLELLLMAAGRHRDTGLVYADYRLIAADGTERDIHLLGHHEGRLRDNQDYGPVWLLPRAVVKKVGGLDEKYAAADLYDLRLKVATRYRLVHLAAARNGHAYVVKAPAAKHNVFDYLLASKEVQLEMEHALTEHLKRIGAYLAPGAHYQKVTYTRAEERQFSDCIASVVIPVFNRKEFIGTAIESVQAQTVPSVEVIVVVNGGKDDPTIEGVKPYLPGGEKYDPNKPKVTLLVEDINNIGYCLNKGLQVARGKYYVQLDSDDRLKPNAVAKILEVFDSDRRIGMVIGSYEVWQKDEHTGELSRMESIPVVTHDEWTEKNGRNNLLRINGAGAPRAAHIKVIKELGGFGTNDSPYARNYGEDYDLVLRLSERYRIGRVWEPIYEVVRHAGGTDHAIDQATIDRNDEAKDFMRLEAVRRRKALNRKAKAA